MLCYNEDDMRENRRWEDKIKMDIKEIDVDVMWCPVRSEM
jgi:hypothetical protein